MTRGVKALAVCEKELTPCIVVVIFDVQDERDVVFNVSNPIGTIMRRECGISHRE